MAHANLHQSNECSKRSAPEQRPSVHTTWAHRASPACVFTFSLSYLLTFPLSNSFRPLAAENLDRRPGHVDVVVRFAPFELKVPAGKSCSDPPAASSSQHAPHTDRRSPRPAGLSRSAAALPVQDADLARSVYLDEV